MSALEDPLLYEHAVERLFDLGICGVALVVTMVILHYDFREIRRELSLIRMYLAGEDIEVDPEGRLKNWKQR